jgi:hypothetical protein
MSLFAESEETKSFLFGTTGRQKNTGRKRPRSVSFNKEKFQFVPSFPVVYSPDRYFSLKS